MRKFLLRALIAAGFVAGGLFVFHTIRDLSTSSKLWEPITDPVE